MLTTVRSAAPAIPTRLLTALRGSLATTETMLDVESRLVFVCGARPAKNKDGARDRLIQYAKKHIKGFEFFIAEDVYIARSASARDGSPANRIDLLSIERQLGEYADCIIMILETESVFAELGAFSSEDALIKKLLVINDRRYKDCHDPSFITLGPLAKVAKGSEFPEPIIYVDIRHILAAATTIEATLATIRLGKAKSVDLSSGRKFLDASKKERLLFVRDLVWFFAPLCDWELSGIVSQLYGEGEVSVRFQLDLLCALGLAARAQDSDYYFPAGKHGLFFRYKGIKEVEARAAIINYYHKNNPERTRAIGARIHGA